MASAWYNKGKGLVMNGGVDLDTDTIKIMAVNASYTFNADHDFVDDVVANEINPAAGYTAGFGNRVTLANKTVTIDNTNDRAYFDADDVTLTNLSTGITVRAFIVIKEITNDAASPVIAYLDASDTATNGSTATIAWDAGGILRIA